MGNLKEFDKIIDILTGDVDILKYFIEHGVDIHEDNEWVLRYAGRYRHLNVVKYLVEHGADIHAYNDMALQSASISGHIEIVRYLIDHGANINVIVTDEPAESVLQNKYLHSDDI